MTHHKLFEESDKAMDDSLTPIWKAKAKSPDPAQVKAAYNTYLEKLKLADWERYRKKGGLCARLSFFADAAT